MFLTRSPSFVTLSSLVGRRTKFGRPIRAISHHYHNRILINYHPSVSPLEVRNGEQQNVRSASNSFTSGAKGARSISGKADRPQKVVHFILPDIGEGINEVVIREWKVKVGDSIQEFDGICDVESDKATATISSRYDGNVTKVYYQTGDTAKVGQPLVDIQLSGTVDVISDPQDSIAPEPAERGENQPTPITSAGRGGIIDDPQSRILTLPSVRRMAEESGVDLSRVSPSGRFGRILKEDLMSYLQNQNSSGSLASPASSSLSSPSQSSRDRDGGSRQTTVDESARETQVKLTGIKRAMFKAMTKSLSIPHFNYSDEVDMTRLVELSKSLRRSGDSKDKISNFAFIIKSVSLALKEFPELNGSVDENGDHLVIKHYHNVGVAVDTKFGLVVPNIKNVQDLSVREINSELLRLRQLGYDNKLGVDDLSGGTISLSNIGAIGGIFGVPVIVAPELVICALGRTRKLPRFGLDGKVEARDVMQIVWSADHRVVDGASVSRFSNSIKSYLEAPELAMIELS